MATQVTADNESSEQLVLHWVDRILDDAEYVETGENGLGELDVLLEGDSRVVAASDRVGGCYNRATRLESGYDTSFGNGDGLLFHGLVDRRSVGVVHLVKLVDEANTLVGEHESTAFQRPFACHWVLAHTGGQTDGGSTLTGSEDGTVCSFLDILQELGFCCTRISEKQDVDVASDPVLAVDILGYAPEE